MLFVLIVMSRMFIDLFLIIYQKFLFIEVRGHILNLRKLRPWYLLLDKNNVIKYPYHSEMGNEIKRNNFYKFLNSLKY